MLDSDKDGLISSSAIDISQLSTDVLEAFSPLLIEMEEIDQTLDLKTFSLAGSRLFQTLDINKKNQIMLNDVGQKSQKQEKKRKMKKLGLNHKFKPQINKNSRIMAERHLKQYG